jgi:hypothetical protein
VDPEKVPAAVAIPPTVEAPITNPIATFDAVLVKRISLSCIRMNLLVYQSPI